MWPLVGQWVEQVIWMSCLLSPTGTHLKDQDGRSVGGLFLWGGPDCGLAGRREEGKPVEAQPPSRGGQLLGSAQNRYLPPEGHRAQELMISAD